MRYMFVIIAICLGLISMAQMPAPVNVETKFMQSSDTTAKIVFVVNIIPGWHVYAVDEEMATPTTLTVEDIKGCRLNGKLTADKPSIAKYDEAFMGETRFYEHSVMFTQEIVMTGDYAISGYMEYGACNNTMCLPPTAVNFSFDGKVQKTKPVVETRKQDVAAEPVVVAPVEISLADSSVEPELVVDLWAPVSYEKPTSSESATSLWLIFWSCFLGGFLALLTPCVWPIIPMTVSFFLKRTKDKGKGIRDSFLYGLSIIVIYLVLGLAITLFAGPNALNALSTNAVFNLVFTAMLIVFGLSFLGAFEITLPSSWSNAVDQKAERTTGIISIFLMAFTLALVSFSCTGPIIGFLLVEVSTAGNLIGPAVGMLGFATALALPFTLFAMFPSMLQKMPRSGSWMMTVKVVLGFIELAFALKFFSVADLAYGWHLLDREVFICIWSALAFLLGLFLIKKLNLGHANDGDSDVSAFRFVGAVASFAFCLYLIPGLWGAPLKAISAFCPPMKTQDFVVVDKTPHAQYTDYEQGMAAAKMQGKPALVDFTGHGCVNCRKMEQSVWSDPQVARMINEDFVLISLYVDDKTPLAERVVIDENTILRTVGDKWSHLQRTKFSVNAQPFYTILDGDGNLLAQPYAFDESVNHFVSFLKSPANK